MTKEKQMIEELADFLWRNTIIHTEDLCHDVAETLIAYDYRKQSEGEWILKSNGYMKILHCSCCEHQEEWPSAYCPNCGAKMKGGAE